jgi:CRISPR system Cascade subunit CasE
MFLTQLTLNLSSRSVMNDINDSYKLHQQVMKGFPKPLPEGERVLFRLEITQNPVNAVMLVQSHFQPNWRVLTEMGYLEKPVEIKSFLPKFQNDQVFQFRLAANPTKRLGSKNEKAGGRIGLFKETDQIAWINRKAVMHGFQIIKVQAAKIIQTDGWKVEDKKTHRIRQFGVIFDGYLRVIDSNLFQTALENGIGSGKGMGFGLLSLMRA